MKQYMHEKLSRTFGIILALCLGISCMVGMFASIMPQPISTEELNSYKAYAISSFEGETDDSTLVAEKSGNTISVYNKEKPHSEAVMFTFDDDGNITRTRTGYLNPYALFRFPQMILKLLVLALLASFILTVIFICAAWITGRL